MKALITGAGGFVGRALTEALLARGDEVRGFARGAYPELEEMGVEMVRGDIADADAIGAAVEGVDVVFHVAARFGFWGKYDDYYETNVTGTENVIRACRDHGVNKLIFTSSPSVVHGGGESADGIDESVPYAKSHDAHYPATKALAEQAVLAANDDELSTIALRPHAIWGPRDTVVPTFIEKSRNGKLRWPGEPQKVDTCYIDNCVHAHLLAADQLEPGADCAGKAYFITQGEPLSGLDFVNDILSAAGRPLVTKSMPASVAKVGVAVLEGAWKTFGIKKEPPLTRWQLNNLMTAHWFDISAAKEDLGYAPLVSYEEGLKKLEAWLRENPI